MVRPRTLAKIAGAIVLWLFLSAAIPLVALWLVFVCLQARAPNDGSVGDGLAWAVILGAPVFVPLSLIVGAFAAWLAWNAVAWRLARRTS